MLDNKIEITPLDLMIEMFRRGMFQFIVEKDGKKHEKQEQALKILTDTVTEEFLYGGAAGGAKTWTGTAWLMFMCLAYPETKWFIGREELKRITESTLITFFKVAKEYGINSFKYNGQKNFIEFDNGSRIDLLELKYQPRDPLYERFGSTEYTGGYIEEGGEVNFGAYDVLRTRIGRHYNDRYGLTAKILITCNPKKNWIYSEYYKPYTRGELTGIKKMLQAFVQDNPFIESGYVERLKRTADKAKKERLLYGNWDYDDNPYSLCGYDEILSMFSNDHIRNIGGRYLTADVARFGSDKAVIGVWYGWELVEIVSFEISKTTEIQAAIDVLRIKHGIPKNKCIADEDGVGGGVVDNCGILGFVNNSRPLKETITQGEKEVPQYENLQAQCLFKLAEKVNASEIYISAEVGPAEREMIIEEVGTIERDPAKAKKLAAVSKKVVKENIGRSPDYRDMLLMRSYFEFNIKKKFKVYA